MDKSIQLSVLQRDAIIELLNIGMGKAGGSLSQMVNEEVKLSIPTLELISLQQVASRLNTSPQLKIAAVKQHFNGQFWGEALLLFEPDKSLELVRVLLKDQIPADKLTQLEPDALTEIGNIIIGACLSSLANLLSQELISDLPRFMTGTAMEILNVARTEKDKIVMFLRMDFALPIKEIAGYLAFILDISSVEQFKASIDNYLGKISNW
jgi:chemotaxis protein CheC